MWIGLDDTDSTTGGCTTFTALKMIVEATKEFDLIGFPRLVRLNPTIPWKTRGNGALAFQIAHGRGIQNQVGCFDENPITSWETVRAELSESERERLWEVLKEIATSLSMVDDEKTNPGMTMMEFQAPFDLYKKAVSQVVTIEEIECFLKQKECRCWSMKKGRGLIGAVAATAWIPGDTTFECLTYRKEGQWGKNRSIDEESVKVMDKSFSTTFDSYDWENMCNRIVPASPCPILHGVRGEKWTDLINARNAVKSEPMLGWLLFESNQATDDHIVKSEIAHLKPYTSVKVLGRVEEEPQVMRGGHVRFVIVDGTGEVDCLAYEPTKGFRETIRALRKGDVLEVYGGIRTEPFAINLEKIHVLHAADVFEKKENPICPDCGKHMKSIGHESGYRCIRCGRKSDDVRMEKIPRSVQVGFYEVPVCARRHLSKPIKRMKEYQRYIRDKK